MRTRQSFRTMIFFAGAKVPVEVVAVYDEPEDNEDIIEIVFICPELTVIYDGMIINDFMLDEDFTYLQQAVDFKIRHAEADAQRALQTKNIMDEYFD